MTTKNSRPIAISFRSKYSAALAAALGMTLYPGITAAQNALHIPPVLTGPVYDLEMKPGNTQFLGGNSTPTAGYNGTFLGPTLIMSTGDQITLNVTNNLGEDTTTHWHGMHVTSANDGGPHSIIPDGETWSPSFTVLDTASTMWYHPHVHGNTEPQVNSGLAGMILVRDQFEAAAGLPVDYGVDEFPLVIQDRSFDEDNSFVVFAFGDTILVNGTMDASLEVPRQMIRFRILNGSNARTYLLGLSDDRDFYVVGTDGGLREAPLPLDRALVGPGERVDIVVDFGGDTIGDTLQLFSYASEMSRTISGGKPDRQPLSGVDFEVMEFEVVAATADPVTSLPDSIWTRDRPEESEATVFRTIQFNGGGGGQGPDSFTLDNQSFDLSRTDQTIIVNTVEIWTLVNNTPTAHPFHCHDIQYYVLDRKGPGDAEAQPPTPYEDGAEDTIIVDAGETLRFIAKFDTFADPEVPYMYHCHILVHEDGGMMGQFIVVDPATLALDLVVEEDNLTLSWTQFLSDFRLQSTTDLSAGFTDVAETPTIVDGTNELTWDISTESRRFFRLSNE